MATINPVGRNLNKASRRSAGKRGSASSVVGAAINDDSPTRQWISKGKGKECGNSATVDMRASIEISRKKAKGSTSSGTSSNPRQWAKPEDSNSSLVAVKPSLLKRFYEALVMLAVLGKSRGDRTEEEELDSELEASDLGPDKLRRSFIRHLAYLCDYEKGGDRTTAIALEQTPQGITYWLASNETQYKRSTGADRTEAFLLVILQILGSSRDRFVHQVELAIFEEAVSFSQSRILKYSKFLNNNLNLVLKYLNPLNNEKDTSLRKWLQDLQGTCGKLQELCLLCYDIASSDQYKALHLRTAAGAPCAERFEVIRHTIGRLNHTMKASKIVVAVSVRLPNLFHDFIIKRKISTSVLPPPLKERNPTLVEIAGRMLSVPNDLTKYLEALEELEQKFNLSTTLHNLCMSPNWTPRVHAELILLDLFWSQNLEFVAGDKYIGCSKPACYCCYHCIKAHPGNFAIPACHNNNYLKWRAPDILDSKDYVGIKAREQILIEMTQKIRNDVVAQIMERRGPAKWKPDSMTEISSVRLDTLQISPVNSAAYSSSNPSPDEALDFSEPDSVTGNYGEYETECEAQIDSTGDEDSDGGVLLVNPGPL